MLLIVKKTLYIPIKLSLIVLVMEVIVVLCEVQTESYNVDQFKSLKVVPWLR